MSELRRAAPMRRRLARVLERVTRVGFSGSAVLSEVAVLDGHTLTGRVAVTGLPRRRATEVLLTAGRSDGRRREVTVGTAVTGAGDLTVPLAVPLEGPGGLGLRTGDWRVTLAYRTLGGAPRPIPTDVTTLAAGRSSPTMPNPRSPVTGLRYRPVVNRQGNFIVRVKRHAAHAEVERVQLAGRQLSLTGRIVGAPKLADRAERAAVVLVVAGVGTTQRRRFPARVSDGTFSATIGLGRLRFDDQADWVVRLRIGNAKPLIVRRALTDLREPGAVYRYPVARLRGGRRITTTYSDNTALLLQGRRLPPPQDGPS